MPKYTIDVKCSMAFVFDTDDYAEDMKENEVDVNDADAVHDYIRNLLDNSDLNDFDTPAVGEVKIELKK